LGWVLNSYADTLTMLYIAAAVGGAGAGAVYGTCVGNSLKWFPDRRGLAAGLTAAGFGAGSALTIIPISAFIKSDGYQAAFFYFGGVPVNIMGLVLPALTFALAIDRVLNGLTRPFFGWVSDQIGRETTMFIAFALEAVGILALYNFGQHPVAFVILTGVVFFA